MNLEYEFVEKYTLDNIKQGYIAPSQIHGYGLFAKVPIYKDEILCVLDGQIMPWKQYDDLKTKVSTQIQSPYENYIFMEWNALDESTLLVRPFRTKYSYINHSRCPNVKIVKYPLRLIAIKDISPDEELTIDYREEALNDEYIMTHGATFL